MFLRCLPHVLVAAMALFGSGQSVQAESFVLDFDPNGSQVTFTLGATGHTVEGTLHMTSGQLILDPANGTASGEIVLDAARTESGNDRRDKKMHKEVLLSAAHPRIVFEVESLQGELSNEGRSDFELGGTMRLVGKDHAMQIQVQLEVEGDRFEGQCKIVIPFTSWGLKDPSVLFLRVDKEVHVTVQAMGEWKVEGKGSSPVAAESAVR